MEQRGNPDGKKHFPKRQEGSPKNRSEGQALQVRQVPKAKSKARQNPSTVVLSKLPDPNRAK